MIGINIKFDLSPWIDTFEKARSQMPVAVSRALNRTGDMVATAVGRELASETGMHVHDVRDNMEQDRSTPGDLTYTITIHGGYTSLAEFDPRQTREGISARVGASQDVPRHVLRAERASLSSALCLAALDQEALRPEPGGRGDAWERGVRWRAPRSPRSCRCASRTRSDACCRSRASRETSAMMSIKGGTWKKAGGRLCTPRKNPPLNRA